MRRMTRQVQIGLSHGEKAKRLSSAGFYGEALKELNIALRAFEAENRDGQWDDAVAGVLNNAGLVYVFMGNYQSAEDTFRSALGLKDRLGDGKSRASTLAGLADAYRGQCRFAEAAATLQEALEMAVAAGEGAMAKTLTSSLDALERTRCDLPDASAGKADFDELYAPRPGVDASARLARLDVRIRAPDELRVAADVGFPYLMQDLDDAGNYPAMALLFPHGTGCSVVDSGVTDEEERPVGHAVAPFDGILYGPGSYCRCGPRPMPSCKQFLYTFGAGHIMGWHIGANGWYHAEATLRVGLEAGLRFFLALPFGSVKLRAAEVRVDGPWKSIALAGGNFLQGRSIETDGLPYVPHKPLYEGAAKGRICPDSGTTMKYGVLGLELVK